MPVHQSKPSDPDLQVLEYVDDLIVRGSAVGIENFMHDIQLKYKIRDYGEPKSFLGMEIIRDNHARTIKLTNLIFDYLKLLLPIIMLCKN